MIRFFPVFAAAAVMAAEIDLFDPSKLKAIRCDPPQVVTYKGKKALQVKANTQTGGGTGALVIVEGVDFQDGAFRVELAGETGAGAAATARGFVGMAFRAASGGGAYEAVYLRPTNGRADDQVRRNHSVQYESLPEFPWSRLRKEFPEKYETYADLQPATWTRLRVVAEGAKVRAHVNGSEHPTLLVNDARRTEKGKIALWVGPGTVAHFTGLVVE